MSIQLTPDLSLYQNKNDFIAAVEYTANVTGFKPELIEKDFFCSVILNILYKEPTCPLIFKGGTLLAKSHAGFYRLSEDLDFTLPLVSPITRKQ